MRLCHLSLAVSFALILSYPGLSFAAAHVARTCSPVKSSVFNQDPISSGGIGGTLIRFLKAFI